MRIWDNPSIKKKYESVEKIISIFRDELAQLGMTGEKVEVPVVQGGDFFFVYTVDVEDDTEEGKFSAFYWIESVNDGIVTYREHSVDAHYLCLRDNIYRTSIENFIDCIDDTYWYRISGNIYLTAAKKIICLTERIFEMFRNNK